MVAQVSSAAGLLALLDDSDEKLQRYALTNLDKVVDQFWFQISSSIASVEALYEDDEFPDRELAALVASKVGPADRAQQWVDAQLRGRSSTGPRSHAGVLPSGRAGFRFDLRPGRWQPLRRQ